jgi:hypothetical protein
MMNGRLKSISCAILLVLLGCEPVAVQYPPGSAQPPYPGAGVNIPSPTQQPPKVQVTGPQRWNHAWTKAMEGAFLGLNIGGPFGGAGGFTLGLLTGLITADSYYGGVNTQIQSEQEKDRQLEAAIAQELKRQGDLENQVAQATPQSSGSSPERSAENPVNSARTAQTVPVTPSTADPIAVASINKSPAPMPPAPFKNMEMKDVNGDGVPDLWIYYNPQNPGEIVRQEEATKYDGTVNAWSYFKQGKLVRRDVDSYGHGKPDTVFYYDGDKIAREERDESGRGLISYRAIYLNGRLTQIEKDTRGEGKIDFWIYYDTNRTEEIITKDEKDLNGDGVVDLWTYYDNGRIVRRDVSAVGLEFLVKQEQLSLPLAEAKDIQIPSN